MNTFLALVGHLCLQWALLEHSLLFVIAAAEKLSTEKAYNYFGATEMRTRAAMALALAHDAKWPNHLITPLKELKKALGRDGEHLSERRNRIVHGVHKLTGVSGVYSLTLPRERGVKREKEISIAELKALVERIGELAARIGRVFDEYGDWKFGTDRQQNVHQPETRVVFSIKQRLISAIKHLLGNH